MDLVDYGCLDLRLKVKMRKKRVLDNFSKCISSMLRFDVCLQTLSAE